MLDPLRIALTVVIACVPSFASVIVFADQTVFDSTVGPTTVETFGSTSSPGAGHSRLPGGTQPAGRSGLVRQ